MWNVVSINYTTQNQIDVGLVQIRHHHHLIKVHLAAISEEIAHLVLNNITLKNKSVILYHI